VQPTDNHPNIHQSRVSRCVGSEIDDDCKSLVSNCLNSRSLNVELRPTRPSEAILTSRIPHLRSMKVIEDNGNWVTGHSMKDCTAFENLGAVTIPGHGFNRSFRLPRQVSQRMPINPRLSKMLVELSGGGFNCHAKLIGVYASGITKCKR
jgi:hypothetical protein